MKPCSEILKPCHAKTLKKFVKANPNYGLKFDEMNGIPYLYYELPDNNRVVFCMTFHQNILDSYFTYSSFSLCEDSAETDENEEEATDPFMEEAFELDELVAKVFKEIKKSRAKVLQIKRVK